MKVAGSNGFTLVELMIVVVIAALLAAVALSSYNQQVLKSRRNLGKGELLELAGRQERFYTENGYYGNMLDIANSDPHLTEDDIYVVTVACFDTVGNAATCGDINQRPQAFTLTANTNAINDPTCGNLTLTQAGQRGISGDVSNFELCWN